MKKFYFLLIALVVGLVANAAAATQLYLIGEPAGGWSPLNGLEMEQTSDGIFELDVTFPSNQWFGFSQKLGANASDWTTMNGARYGAPSNNYVAKLDEVVSLRYPSENSFQMGAGDYHFIVNTNDNTFKATGQTVEDPLANVFYLRGDVSGWNVSDAYKFTADGNTYTLSVPQLNGSFKIANHDYSKQFSATSPIALDTPTAVSNLGSANSTLADGTITDATLTFVMTDNSNGTLTITGTVVGGGDEPVDYSKWYVNIIGPFNGWGDNGLNPDAEGVSKHSNLAIGTDGFKVKIYNGTSDIYYVTDGSEIVPGEWTQMYEDAYDASPAQIQGATADAVYDVEYNCSTNQVKVTLVSGGGEDPEPPVVDYTTWYVNVLGDFNSWGDNGVNPNEEGISIHEELPIGTTGFKVKTWNGSDTYYVSDSTDPIAVGEWVQLYQDAYNAAPIQIADATESSVYNVEFNCATNEVKLTLIQGEDPEPTPTTKSAIYDFAAIAETYAEADWTADPSAKTNSFVNVSDQQFDSNGFSLVATKSTNTDARIYKTSAGVVDLRVYKNGGTVTITAPADYYFTELTLTSAGSNSASNLASLTIEEADADNPEWTSAAIDSKALPEGMKSGMTYTTSVENNISTVKFATNTSKNVRISKIELLAETITNGIESVVVDNNENAPVEYYNLQGVRVENPAAGLYIRRQGNKATKVIIR